jgi:hypothetical protein
MVVNGFFPSRNHGKDGLIFLPGFIFGQSTENSKYQKGRY